MTPEEKINICKACPLYKVRTDGKAVCNNGKYMDPITEQTSYLAKKGYVRGCACILDYKTRSNTAHCPAKKW